MARERRPDPAAAAQAREEKLAALHETLHQQVVSLRTGTDWQAWLTTASRFHDYSAPNVLLIAAQCPDATRVAGYRAWQALGRQVDRGEAGIAILAPVVARSPGAATTNDAPTASAASAEGPTAEGTLAEPMSSTRSVVGFRVTHVFDVSQTSGDPLPEQPRPMLLAGQAPDGLVPALEGLLVSRGYTVTRGDCGTANGFTDFTAREVRVRTGVDDAQAAKTLAHEVGHVLLHDPTDGSTATAAAGDRTTARCRGVAEVEAESVAYLVAASHGATTDGYSFPYVAGWAGAVDPHQPETVVRATADRVLRAARTVLATTQPADPADIEALQRLGERAHAGVATTERLAEHADDVHARTAAPPVAASSTPPAPAVQPTFTLADAVADRPRDPSPLLAAHTDATAWFATLTDSSWVPRYLAGRDALLALTPAWGGGYAPAGWTGLVDHLRAGGHDEQAIEDAGLATRARTGHLVDRFRDRFVLPVRDPSGAVVAFIGRAPDGAGPDVPKYLNSPETAIYRKGDVLLGLAEGRAAQPDPRWVVLVEGPMDVLAVATSAAVTHARVLPVSPCGTALTTAQAGLLGRLRPDPLLVCFDGDPAGRAAAARAFDTLPPSLQAVARDARLRSADDPAELLAAVGPRRLAAELLIAQHAPLADHAVDVRLERHRPRLVHVEGQVGAMRDVARYVATLPPPLVARQVTRLATQVGAPPCEVNQHVLQAVVAERPGEASASAERVVAALRPAGPQAAERRCGPSTAGEQSHVTWARPQQGQARGR